MVDFVIVSTEFYDKVAYFSVGDLPTFSDHCPLKLAINLTIERNRQTKNILRIMQHIHYCNHYIGMIKLD